MSSRQVSQLFQAALELHTFAARYQRVRKTFIVTFQDRQCSPLFLNASSYLQEVLDARPANVLYTSTPTIFDELLCFHFISLVHSKANADRLRVKVSYRV